MLRSCLAVICLAELLALGATTAPQEPSRRLCVMLSRLRGGMPDMFPWERPYKTNAERWAEAGVSLQVWRGDVAAGTRCACLQLSVYVSVCATCASGRGLSRSGCERTSRGCNGHP